MASGPLGKEGIWPGLMQQESNQVGTGRLNDKTTGYNLAA